MADERCHAYVWSGFGSYQCSRKAWKGQFCKQHHPDTIKAKLDARNNKYEERRAADRKRESIAAAERAVIEAAEKWIDDLQLEGRLPWQGCAAGLDLRKAVDALRKARQ